VNSSVSLEAERELIDGALFHAREANAELGLAFIAEFERSLGVLCNYPRLGPVWRGTARRFPLRRFPYTIIYQVKPEEARVIALAHQSRRPGYWRGRK
jgi:plasmid stabilization system protein ParE